MRSATRKAIRISQTNIPRGPSFKGDSSISFVLVSLSSIGAFRGSRMIQYGVGGEEYGVPVVIRATGPQMGDCECH